MSTSSSPSSSKLFAVLSLACGVIGITLFIVFLFSMIGAVLAWSALAVGLLGLILGIVALAKGQPKALALTGLVLSSLTTLLVIALVIFALIFVGAIPH